MVPKGCSTVLWRLRMAAGLATSGTCVASRSCSWKLRVIQRRFDFVQRSCHSQCSQVLLRAEYRSNLSLSDLLRRVST